MGQTLRRNWGTLGVGWGANFPQQCSKCLLNYNLSYKSMGLVSHKHDSPYPSLTVSNEYGFQIVHPILGLLISLYPLVQQDNCFMPEPVLIGQLLIVTIW